MTIKRRHIRMARAAWKRVFIRVVIKQVAALRRGFTYTESPAEIAVRRAYRAAKGKKA